MRTMVVARGSSTSRTRGWGAGLVISITSSRGNCKPKQFNRSGIAHLSSDDEFLNELQTSMFMARVELIELEAENVD